MIAIPNMDKPKDCEVCPFSILDGAVTDDNKWVSYSVCDLLGKTIGDADMLNDCPLIEIVRCEECKWFDGEYGIKECTNSQWEDYEGYMSKDVEETDFCSYGERKEE